VTFFYPSDSPDPGGAVFWDPGAGYGKSGEDRPGKKRLIYTGMLTFPGIAEKVGVMVMQISEKAGPVPLSTRVAIFVVLLIIDTLLAAFGVITYNIAFGISGFYIAVAFMIAFTLWFGGWGAMAAYLGCIMGAGIVGGVPPALNPFWSLADLWEVLIPLAAFRAFHADIGLATGRDFLVFLGFGWLANNAVGALWGGGLLALGGVAPWGEVPGIFADWFIVNLVVTILITPLLLHYVTPWIRKSGLSVTKYWG
jgi:hypothetical protein